MQISAINNNQINTNFEAKLEFSGGKRLLSKNNFKKIKQKISKLGTSEDTVYIDLKRCSVINNIKNSGLIHQGYSKTTSLDEYTEVSLEYFCPSLNNYGRSQNRIVIGNDEERQEKTFDIINRYIDNIKNLNKK